jgi:hypothetical protein
MGFEIIFWEKLKINGQPTNLKLEKHMIKSWLKQQLHLRLPNYLKEKTLHLLQP